MREVYVQTAVTAVTLALEKNVQNANERKLICCVTKACVQNVAMVVSPVLVKLALNVELGVWIYYVIEASVKDVAGGATISVHVRVVIVKLIYVSGDFAAVAVMDAIYVLEKSVLNAIGKQLICCVTKVYVPSVVMDA